MPSLPIPSMHGIFTYIYHKHQPNVGKYSIHGWYGLSNSPEERQSSSETKTWPNTFIKSCPAMTCCHVFLGKLSLVRALGILVQIHGKTTPKLTFLLRQSIHGLKEQTKVLEIPELRWTFTNRTHQKWLTKIGSWMLFLFVG